MRANGGLQTLARSFIRNPNRRSRLFSHGSNPLVFVPPPSLLHSLLPSSSAAAVSPNPFPTYLGLFSPKIRRWISFSGPLFLSSPAWKLSQSATPLHFPAKERIFPRDLQQQSRIFRIESGAIASGKARIGAGEAREIAAGVRAEEQFLNLPNLVSISRMLSGPVIGWMIMNEWYLPAFCGLAISGATDWLDGFLARKMNVKSILGSYLDPLADKVLIGCVALAMVEKDLLHPGLVGLVLFRDVGLVGGAFYKRASNLGWEWKTWSEFFNLDATRQERMEPLLISKVNTVFQLLLVAAALLQPEFGSKDTQLYITYMSWLVATTTVASATAYGMQHLCKSIKIQS